MVHWLQTAIFILFLINKSEELQIRRPTRVFLKANLEIVDNCAKCTLAIIKRYFENGFVLVSPFDDKKATQEMLMEQSTVLYELYAAANSSIYVYSEAEHSRDEVH